MATNSTPASGLPIRSAHAAKADVAINSGDAINSRPTANRGTSTNLPVQPLPRPIPNLGRLTGELVYEIIQYIDDQSIECFLQLENRIVYTGDGILVKAVKGETIKFRVLIEGYMSQGSPRIYGGHYGVYKYLNHRAYSVARSLYWARHPQLPPNYKGLVEHARALGLEFLDVDGSVMRNYLATGLLPPHRIVLRSPPPPPSASSLAYLREHVGLPEQEPIDLTIDIFAKISEMGGTGALALLLPSSKPVRSMVQEDIVQFDCT
ncbi:uncharacterized protein PAC_00229 [Phialocephala subalpina]|uniref:Uncharacterized protein n=1 Tax=Phialocephala subalpina TaxID=576137 RepID=A0A1L7WC47_9HELO|nr:uncharacterized protein PAC_00229 [Phialocephala subalpina]